MIVIGAKWYLLLLQNSALNVFNDIIKRFSFHNIVNWLFGLAGLEREIEVEHCSVVCCELWSIDKGNHFT